MGDRARHREESRERITFPITVEIQFTKGGLRDRFNRNEDSKSLESFDDRIYSGRSN